jgi:5'(3')-deoxyribonucleotidase
MNTMGRRRVLLDVDGVIANFGKLYLSIVWRRLGLAFSESQITKWDVGDAIGLTDAQREEVHKDLYAPGAALQIEPYPGAIQGVKNLAKLADVFFVTSPLLENPSWVPDRKQWLLKYFGEELAQNQISTEKKYPIYGDVFVDDKPRHIEEWKAEWPYGTAILWSMPYNQEAVCLKATTWTEVQKFLQMRNKVITQQDAALERASR